MSIYYTLYIKFGSAKLPRISLIMYATNIHVCRQRRHHSVARFTRKINLEMLAAAAADKRRFGLPWILCIRVSFVLLRANIDDIYVENNVR